MLRILIVLLVVTDVVSSTAAQALGSGWSPSDTCQVSGFSLKEKQLPAERDASFYPKGTQDERHWGRVVLYTIRSPGQNVHAIPQSLPNLYQTAAACLATPECVMFTSDGFLIGAYRSQTEHGTSVNDAIVFEQRTGGGPISWQHMAYCPGKCCGTWVANGVVDTLSKPRVDSKSGSGGGGGGGPRSMDAGDRPSDGVQGSEMAAGAVKRVCSSSSSQLQGGTSSSPQGGAGQCPTRCLVACCQQAAAGNRAMAKHFFAQCSATLCNKPCGFGAQEYGAASAGNVLVYAYLRASSNQQGGVVATEAAPKSQPRGGCGKSLC